MARQRAAVRPSGRIAVLVLLAVVGLAITWLVVLLLDRSTSRAGSSAEHVQLQSGSEQPVAPPGRSSDVAEPVGWSGVFDLVLKLLAVLVLIYISLALLRRYSGGSGFARGPGLLQIVDATTLGPNRMVYLLRVRDKQVLVGATATQIVTLAQWDVAPAGGSQPPVPGAPWPAPDDQPVTDFESLLNRTR